MRIDDAIRWVAIVANFAAAAVNLWILRRTLRERLELRAQVRALLPCAALVAFLSREESGAPAPLRKACADVLPADATIVITRGETIH